jgi:transposase
VEGIVERAAGLDVGKDEVVACIGAPDAAGVGRGRRRQQVGTYPRFTSSLEALADWLQAEGITQGGDGGDGAAAGSHAGMCWRSAGWSCCWSTPATTRILPGRKTDVCDAAWLAELLEHGLLRGSFVPPVASGSWGT